MSSILTKIFSLESTWLITIVAAVCTFFLAKSWLKIRSYPPGPVPIPLLGNLFSFFTKDHPFTVINSFRKQYGDIFTLWLGAEPAVMICNWNLTKEALVTRSRDFIGRPKRMFGDILEGGHDGVVFGNGPKWEYLRKIAATAVRNFVMSENFRDTICGTVDEMTEKMINDKQPFNPKEQVFFAIHNIIAKGSFGERYQEDEREYADVRATNEALIKEFAFGMPGDVLPFLRPFFWNREQRFRTGMKRFRSTLLEKYHQHSDSYQPGKIRDFTDTVIAARKEAEMEGNKVYAQLTDEGFVNIVVDLFLGGTHTTNSAIMWMIILLGHYEDVQQKMVAEIDQIVGSRWPTQDDKAECHYTSAVIMEVLRFRTIVPFGMDHKAMCDTEIGGYPIKKDTTVIFNLYAQNMDPNNWPQPTKFEPERFLEGDTLSNVRKDSYVAFSAGRRNCLGEKLALTEIFLFIVRILQKCKITLPNGPGTADLGLTDQILFCSPKPYQICMQKRDDHVT